MRYTIYDCDKIYLGSFDLLNGSFTTDYVIDSILRGVNTFQNTYGYLDCRFLVRVDSTNFVIDTDVDTSVDNFCEELAEYLTYNNLTCGDC